MLDWSSTPTELLENYVSNFIYVEFIFVEDE